MTHRENRTKYHTSFITPWNTSDLFKNTANKLYLSCVTFETFFIVFNAVSAPANICEENRDSVGTVKQGICFRVKVSL